MPRQAHHGRIPSKAGRVSLTGEKRICRPDRVEAGSRGAHGPRGEGSEGRPAPHPEAYTRESIHREHDWCATSQTRTSCPGCCGVTTHTTAPSARPSASSCHAATNSAARPKTWSNPGTPAIFGLYAYALLNCGCRTPSGLCVCLRSPPLYVHALHEEPKAK